MKIGFTLLMLMVIVTCKGQRYESYKQKYLRGLETEFTPATSHKSISIINDTLCAELPTGGTFKGKVKFSGNQTYYGKVGKRYDLGDNDLVVIYSDEIFLNIMRHENIAITYYMPNYKKPSTEQQKLQEKKDEETTYNWDLHLYGKYTADCIKENRVKIGMNCLAIESILGKPTSVNITQTASGYSEQYVYPHAYIYSINGKVTAIQQRIKY